MSLGLLEHLYVEDLVTAMVEVAEMVVMVATVVAKTMAIEVDTLEAAIMAVEEVVEEAVVFSVTSLVPLIGIVPKVKGTAAEVVDILMDFKSRSMTTIGAFTGIVIVHTTLEAATATTMATTALSITVDVSTTSVAIAFTLGKLPSKSEGDGDGGDRYSDGDGRRDHSGLGGGGDCYKCGEDGHYASEWTNCVWLYFLATKLVEENFPSLLLCK
ncbi:hypothetical protein H5410_007758 [Solanum commersonii]|uniref:CCHC-type domain-containing protein n=1 Tax=Solanum commersonii TaxID=4109 RepID=A0A9J6AE35_SOLCO|nr:hypothetical protein H5410_007758 [Solanum commersonii]